MRAKRHTSSRDVLPAVLIRRLAHVLHRSTNACDGLAVAIQPLPRIHGFRSMHVHAQAATVDTGSHANTRRLAMCANTRCRRLRCLTADWQACTQQPTLGVGGAGRRHVRCAQACAVRACGAQACGAHVRHVGRRHVRCECRGGNVVREVARLGLLDNIPIEFDATREGPRSISWRGDKPAELKWVEALDGGDPKKNPDTAPRDAVYSVDLSAAAGDAEPRRIATTDLRCAPRPR